MHLKQNTRKKYMGRQVFGLKAWLAHRKTYKIGSIIILRLVLTVAADRLHLDKDHGCVSAVNCYLNF